MVLELKNISKYYGDRKILEIEDLKVYLYSKAKGRMLGCDLETLIKLEENGLKIGRNGVEKPVKILSKSIKRFKEKQKEQDNGDEAR